jgi:hypothetical protein
MRPLFTQERVAASASVFVDGLLGSEGVVQNPRFLGYTKRAKTAGL